MKGDKTKEILSILEGAAQDSMDFISVFITSGYGTSVRKFEYEMDRKKALRDTSGKKRMFERMIYNLKSDGLVEIKENKNKKQISLTRIGKDYLQKLNKNTRKRTYKITKEENPTIIIFDIPESMKKKREWLRKELVLMGFEQIQKSVWKGSIKIPTEFIEDIDSLGLTKYIEIFSVLKYGSLSK